MFINRVGRQLCFSTLLTADRPQADVSGHAETVPWVSQTPAMRFCHGGAVPTSALLDLAKGMRASAMPDRSFVCSLIHLHLAKLKKKQKWLVYYLLYSVVEDTVAQKGKVTCTRSYLGISAQLPCFQV